MTTRTPASRPPLDRTQVVEAAIRLADEDGIEPPSMRRLADALGVTPMALYKHVANREQLIDAMVDHVVAEIDVEPAPSAATRAAGADPLLREARVVASPPSMDAERSRATDADWSRVVRSRIMSARAALTRHPWAQTAIETRTSASPVVLAHMDALMAAMFAGGLSADLVHHGMHALSTRMWGFNRDVLPTPAVPDDPAERARAYETFADDYPAIVQMATQAHRTGPECDADAEFAFALDLLLDGIERRYASGWTP